MQKTYVRVRSTRFALFLALCVAAIGLSFRHRIDPALTAFAIDDSLRSDLHSQINLMTVGLSRRTQLIDSESKTLVLILDGQSLLTPVAPKAYVPTNYSTIDQFNIYDGELYEPSSPPLGQAYVAGAPYGPGHVGYRIADNFRLNGRFDRIICVFTAIGQSTFVDHATGKLKDRNLVAMRRLASRGITPATPGVTFAYMLGLGETDNGLGTTSAAAATGIKRIVANLVAAGFAGRIFINRETWAGGIVSPAIKEAQIAMANGITIFAGPDWDSLGASYRNSDNTHWSEAGILAAGDLAYNSMVESGAPF